MDVMLTAGETAFLLKLTPARIGQMARTGALRYRRRHARMYLFRLQDVLQARAERLQRDPAHIAAPKTIQERLAAKLAAAGITGVQV